MDEKIQEGNKEENERRREREGREEVGEGVREREGGSRDGRRERDICLSRQKHDSHLKGNKR